MSKVKERNSIQVLVTTTQWIVLPRLVTKFSGRRDPLMADDMLADHLLVAGKHY